MELKKLLKTVKFISGKQIREALYCAFIKPKVYPSFLKYGIQGRYLDKNKSVWDAATAGSDHIELSGKQISGIISYGRDKKGFLQIYRHLAYPALRLKPNLTQGTFTTVKKGADIYVGAALHKNETVKSVKIGGNLEILTTLDGLEITRECFPSPSYPAFIERIEVKNVSGKNLDFAVEVRPVRRKSFFRGIRSGCALTGENGDFRSFEPCYSVEKTLYPNGRCVAYQVFYAVKKGENLNFNAAGEYKERNKTLTQFSKITLKTDDENINALFSHALLRGYGGISQTGKGLLHSPGGGRYYAAIWANDQMEYALPLFPYFDISDGITAAKNSIELYSEYSSDKKPLPSSIVGGGLYPIGIAGDRGDTAMVGSGLSRFLLTLGDKSYAEKHYGFLKNCIDYTLSQKTEDGVIFSDSDELENRVPSGKCNLSTNILTLDMLKFSKIIADELGEKADSAYFENEIESLTKAIKAYFEAEVEGYETYRYYEGCKVLRSWSILPLTAGFTDRADSVLKGVFDVLYKNGKLKTASNKEIYWDRSLLYALRAGFVAGGKKEYTQDKLSEYSKERILGVHAPYPYEAFPEGNGSHLSAESLLYIRIITEGIFGLEPKGFKKLKIKPYPIQGKIAMKELTYAQKPFGIEFDGETVTVKLGNKTFNAIGGGVFDFEKEAFTAE